ncbi:MAG: AAA family ATPase [Nostoc sp.]|uniref:AAA family ATPase n=1 Tax=Nostoc sp. TaxID=1180 RepID=UPI002FF919F6
MMIALPGFEIVTLLKAGVKAVIYRGIKLKDQCPVIIKGLRPEQCTPNNIEQLKHEYAIAQRLNTAAAVKAYALEMYQGIPYLIMEDFGGRSLDHLLDQFQQPVPFLKIAIEITSKLAQIHTCNIVHKDIKPQNILVNVETNQVKIADFGIAAFIPYQQQIVSSSSRIEGSLPYLSPEQTGRMNRGIDHRSDLYSLGVTFYEMLTGQLPFQGKDPLEWVHCHIAKSPLSLTKLNSDIPQMLCEIIMKLLSKVAEQRYQSALGLQFDLEQCLKQLQTTGEIQSFILGEQDICDRFQIPQKLYGREQDIAKLLQAFERVVSQGKPEIVFVSGYAGVGKSSIVKEIHKPIVRERGVFISGKFDQYKRDIPYSTIVQAFQTLARQILTQPENQLRTWKKRIQAALGNNGRLITDVIPEVELIVGEQPSIPELGPAESQNRFNLVFQKFINVFAQKEHPLTVFLDDMQWADSATLNLIQTVITGSSIKYLCFILAYRDNEIDIVHPLNLMIEKVRQYGAITSEIILTPLNLVYVNQLIADTLHSSTEQVQPLAQLIIQKTDGNPFFINEFLKTLHQENLLNFNRQHGVWQWNLAEIEAQGITDNFVSLMIGRMQKLPLATQQVLQLASCIGNRFDLEVLAIVGEQSIEETANALFEAILRGLIISIESDETAQKNSRFRFYHDRVQQAAYGLIADESKSAVHLKIGRLLLNNASHEQMLLVSIFRDIPTGYAFSEMTIQLNEKLHDLKLRGVVLHIHGSHINVWRNHIASDIPFLERGFIGCVEAGDVTMANYNAYQGSWQIIQLGSPLADTYKSLEKYTTFARQSKHEAVYETIRLQQMLLMNLRGLTHQNLTLNDDNFDESRALSVITDAGFASGIIFYHIIKLIIFFTYRQYTEALNSVLELSKLPVTTLALPIETDYVLYYSLTLTALYPTVSDQEQEQFLQTLESHQQQLQYWANHCAANFLHKSQLVAAEIARIQGRDLEAMRLYEQSIASAREQGFVQYEALANELGAKFYLKQEFELIAKTYLQAAKNAYMRWEAFAKVNHLEECYPQLLPQQQHISNGTFITTGEDLDFLSVVKASQTISSEIVFSRLLKTLMQIVIEQAGAEIGYLLLEHEQNLVIEVDAKVNPQAEKLNVYRPRLKGEISEVIPQSMLNYVQRTQETVILENATEQNLFSKDEYVIQKQPKSVLCLPITRQSKLLGILYLENNLISSAFTQEKLSVLEILTVQIAISLENARLYQGLENSQAQLNLALKSAKIGVWSWDIPNDQFDWDEQTYQLFGLTPETFAGTSEAILARLHPDDRGLLAQSLNRAINEGVEHNLEYRIIRDDGTIRYLSCRGKAFFNEAEKATHMSGVVLDITERKQSEAERIQLIQEQTARQEAEADQQRAEFLVKISATLASSLDYESTLASVANLVVPYFADWCGVDLLQDNQSINRVAVAHRDPEKVKFGWELYERYPRDLDAPEGVPKVLRTGLAEMVAEISDAALAAAIADPEHLRILRELGLKSCMILPLKARERIFGVISFVTAESERRYSTADLSLAEDIAHRAAIAIDNARLYQEAQQAQKTAEIALERIARLQSITAALSESLTPAQVSEVIVEQSMAALGASSALVALLNESKTELEIVRAVGYKQDLIDTWRNFPIDSPSPLAEAVRTGQPIWAEPIQNRVARYPHLTQMYAQYDFEAWITIPLMVEGWAVGGISLGFAHFQELSGEDQAFILAVAQQCAQAIARAHLYEAERTARNAAESANRIKDEFLAVLSHELRTPLNPILGWAKLMRSRKLDKATSDRALETIERNAKLQTQLIEDLLDVSRILQGKLNLNFEPINLVSVIEAAIETVRLSAQAKSIQIQTILKSGVGQVLGDANRLQQVIWNILSNAIKFTPTGGEVKIKLEQVDSQVQICVTDTGKGIVPEFLPYVFDYFRQADGATTRKFGGLGLGLAIVRHLVELHGGTVQAESLGEGKGATFTVKLPCLEDESKGIKDEKDNSSLVATQFLPLSNLEILVVDDDADMREFLPFMLEQYGATVTVVASAIAALTALSQSQPNLIISDIGMPEMDGYMLMRQVRSLQPEQGGTIPAIALTAYAGEIDHQQAIAVGFQLHISKPVDPEELVKAIVLLDL